MDAALSMIPAGCLEADPASAALARLEGINLDDLIASFGWQDRPFPAGLARSLLRRPARTFARQILEFDAMVGRDGLANAARSTLAHYVRNIRVVGRENLPTGPFLALSNHPGMTDTLSLFAALDRPDLRVVALERPFLQALPHTSRYLETVAEGAASSAVVRRIGAHLRAGGAALSFPAGRIEPDPSLRGGAARSLEAWSPSAGLFLRFAPGTPVLPVVVRGVVWPMVAHAWLGRSGPAALEPGKVAAALQLLGHVALKIRPPGATVRIGRPILVPSGNARAIHEAVLAEMERLIREPVDDAMVSPAGFEPATY